MDDLAFSSDNPRGILNVVVATLQSAGFRISRRKLEIMGPHERKVLNGVLLGQFPTAPHEKIARIRSGIHKLGNKKSLPTDMDRYVMGLRGSIAHVKSIVPGKARSLSAQLEAALKRADKDGSTPLTPPSEAMETEGARRARCRG